MGYVPDQQPAVGGDVVTGIDRASLDRIGRATRHVEGTYWGGTPRPRNGPHGDDRFTQIFRVTVTVTASSGASYGKGKGVMQTDNGTALADGTTPEATQALKNLTDKAIAAGPSSYVFCDWWNGGWWVVVPRSCSMLS